MVKPLTVRLEMPHHPHIIDDGVGDAEASDHIDLDGVDDDMPERNDETLSPAR